MHPRPRSCGYLAVRFFLIAGIIVSLALFAVWGWVGASLFSEHDRMSDLQVLLKEDVRDVFWLPPEATVVGASSRSGPLNHGFEIRFRLPNTQLPARWLAMIARRSDMADSIRSPFLYECRRSLHQVLLFDPMQKVYVMEAFFD